MKWENYCVYMHVSPDGRKYIGVTCQNPKKRWGKNGNGYSRCKRFQNAIKEIGWDSFYHIILADGLSEEAAHKEEERLVILHQANNPKYGFNTFFGGLHGAKGYKWEKEDVQKRSDALKGHETTAETRKKIGDSNRGRKHTAESRKHFSESHKGKFIGAEHPRSKAVSLYSLSGEYICTYGSIGEAERNTGDYHSGIINCCKEKFSQYRGHIWRYCSNDDKEA